MNGDRGKSNEIDAYREAEAALFRLIRGDRAGSRTSLARRQRAVAKLDRTRRLLEAMGNPQHRYPTIHVTGTSGKGSTATLIASMLSAAGYRVGLRTSPFLQVATEKLQIGGKLIDAESLRGLTHRVLSCAGMTMGGEGRIGYAEAWSAISFQWFADRNVDLAVIEVGAGGEFDSTNVIEPAVSVITSVGMDHVISLGPTLADIAWHKAGIIKPGGVVVVGPMPEEARRVIDQRAHAVKARIVEVHEPGVAHTPVMRGAFQRFNAALALATVDALQAQGFLIPGSAVRQGIRSARIPGRLEQMPYCHEPIVWIDGAHNVDKVAALAREAQLLGSDWESELPVVVLGLLASKDATPIVDELIPIASAFVVTQPTVVGKTSLSAPALRKRIAERGFTGELVHEEIPARALDRALALASEKRSSVLVTGSLYLAGELRSRWFPNDEIVIQRTAWPTTR